jgi:hypothetical protein
LKRKSFPAKFNCPSDCWHRSSHSARTRGCYLLSLSLDCLTPTSPYKVRDTFPYDSWTRSIFSKSRSFIQDLIDMFEFGLCRVYDIWGQKCMMVRIGYCLMEVIITGHSTSHRPISLKITSAKPLISSALGSDPIISSSAGECINTVRRSQSECKDWLLSCSKY